VRELLVSGGSWAAVVVATVVASATLGALFTRPIWTRRDRSRLVPLLLALQGGAALVVGAIVAGAAVRSWQLVDRPASAPVRRTLMTVSRVDGDGSIFALVVLAVVAAAVLGAVVLFLAARFATTDAPAERTIACVVLGLQVGLCGYGLAALLGGTRTAATVVSVVNLPLAMAAMVACWPPRALDGP
jgi:hypothetical protein